MSVQTFSFYIFLICFILNSQASPLPTSQLPLENDSKSPTEYKNHYPFFSHKFYELAFKYEAVAMKLIDAPNESFKSFKSLDSFVNNVHSLANLYADLAEKYEKFDFSQDERVNDLIGNLHFQITLQLNDLILFRQVYI